MTVEHGRFGISKAQPGRKATITNVAPKRSGCATCSSTNHDPCWNGMLLASHLAEDGFSDVVVAAPIRCPLSVGELVHVMAAEFSREPSALGIHFGCAVQEVTLSPIEGDLRNLFR